MGTCGAFKKTIPSSLKQQINTELYSYYYGYDAECTFNVDNNFWFKEMGKMDIHQSDFILTALHEYLHGFGFAYHFLTRKQFTKR